MRNAPESDGLEPLREAASLVRFAGLILGLDARTLARESGEPIPLTRGEFALLRVFVTRPGRVLSRDTLLDALANRRFEPFDRSVDVLIRSSRRKIEPDSKQPCLIVTVPGEGYRFDASWVRVDWGGRACELTVLAGEMPTQNRRGSRPHLLLSYWPREPAESPRLHLLLLTLDTASCTVQVFPRRLSSNFHNRNGRNQPPDNYPQERRLNTRPKFQDSSRPVRLS